MSGDVAWKRNVLRNVMSCLALHMPELVSNLTSAASDMSCSPLIGRDADVRHVTRLLGDGIYDNAGAHCLVTLCGCHGVGKSALAMEAARSMNRRVAEDEFLGKPGVLTTMMVDCRGCDGTFGSLTSRILAVFGLRHRQPYDTGYCDVITTCVVRLYLVCIERYCVIIDLMSGYEAWKRNVTSKQTVMMKSV